MNASFTAGEKSAAVLDSENHADRSRSSRPGSSSASSSGRAIASPVIMMLFTFSSAIARHTRAGSNLPTSTTLLPRNEPPITPHCVAPCMSGAIGSIVVGPGQRLLDERAGVVDPGVGHGVDAATEREEHVLVAPHHALGHAGRAARVEDVAVVARSGPEVALG